MKWQDFIYGLLILEGKPLIYFVKNTRINHGTINNYLRNKTKPNKKIKINLLNYSKKFNLSLNKICEIGKTASFLNKEKNWAFFLKGIQIITKSTSRRLSKKLKISYSTFSKYKISYQKPYNDYRILKKLFEYIEKQKLNVEYTVSIGEINWNEEIIKIMKELKLTAYQFSKLFPTSAQQDIISWINGTKISNYQALNKILKIKKMLIQNIDKRKILFYINKESFLNNKLRLKLYLMRRYYLGLGQIEAENIFKREIIGVEAGTIPISQNKFQEFKDRFNSYFIKKYNKTSKEIEKEIENKIKLKQFSEIKQWYNNCSNKIINFDSKELTNQEKIIGESFKGLGFNVFLHPVLASEDLTYKKQADCYAIQNDKKMDIFIECKDVELNKFKDRSQKIITELLTLNTKISPKLIILLANGFTKQQHNLLINNKILPLTNKQVRLFSKRPDLFKKQINDFITTYPTPNNFIPQTYSKLKRWRNLNYLSRKKFTTILKNFNINIHPTQLYEREKTDQLLPEDWIKCLVSIENIKKEKGLRYLFKLTKNNLPPKFDSVIGIKKSHPFGKSLEVKCGNYLKNLDYSILPNVILADNDLKIFPSGREIDIIGINKKGEKILASCRTKHGSRQISREIVDLKFLLDSLKEFNKAYFFTSKISHHITERAKNLNIDIIDTRMI